MIVAVASVTLPAGSCRLQIRDDGRFDFFAVRMKPQDSVLLDCSGPISELPLAAEGMLLCFRALPPAIMASLIPTAPPSPDKTT